MTHASTTNRHNGELGTTRPSDVVISPDGGTIYTSGPDGAVRVYDAETGTLLSTWQVGTALGGIDLSPDGSFLIVLEAEPVSSYYAPSGWPDNQFIVAAHKVSTDTGAVTTFLHTATGYEWAFHDVAIMADGTAFLTQKILPGWSGWPQPEVLDTETGVFTSLAQTIRHNSILSDSASGETALLAEYDTSDAPLRIFTSGAGLTAVHHLYQDDVFGFNYGVQALSHSGGLVAQHVAGSGLHIYDLQLQYALDLTDQYPQWENNVSALAFDATGSFLFILDPTADAIVQLSTADWSTVGSIPVGADITSTTNEFGSRLIVGPNMRYFTVITETGLRQIDNPNASATISGTAGADNVTGTGLYDHIYGFEGSDQLLGLGGDDQLFGAGGDDILHGGAGADRMEGGTGNDIYYVDNAADAVVEAAGEGTDEVRTSLATYSLAGTNLERLTGLGAGAQTLTGNNFVNRIDGGAGADTMAGGLHNDTYVVDNVGDVVVENANEGVDTIESSVSWTLGSNVENLTLTGTAAINATGHAGANILTGNSGANRLDGGAGADRMSGGDGDDRYIVDDIGDRVFESSAAGGYDTVFSAVSFSLTYQYLERLELTGTANVDATGNSQANTLVGNAGSNILDGGIGVDVMGGRGGDDTYIVDHVGDSVIESAGGGTDTVLSHVTFHLSRSYEIENLTLLGSSNVSVYGNHLNNRLEANDNNNILNGSEGADIMIGKKGTDTYYVDNEGDVVVEEADGGVDTVRTWISYTLGDHVENVGLEGNAAANLTGNALNNRLSGNHGANRLDGGAGADVMNGYRGDDIYIVDNIGDVVQEFDPLGGNDTVLASVSYRLSGTQVETLQLTGDAAIDGTGHNGNNTVIGNDAANRLYGKLGNDVLQGGGGADGFMFDTALSATSNVDTILDFSVADDTIHLSRAVFKAIGADGALAASAFQLGTAAQDADDRIVYDAATGSIFYDADGSGAGAAVLFATVTAGTQLTHLDFSVYTPG